MNKQPSERLLMAFFNTLREIRRQFATSPVSHLTLAQLETLGFVCQKKQAQMKELADFLAITPPSATFLANHLVKLGLLIRSVDAKDRRLIYLRISTKGQKMFIKTKTEKNQIIRKMLSRLTDSEQAQLLRLLERMSAKERL